MAHRSGLIPGRIPPDEMFPAGDDRFRVQFVTLPSGLRLRIIECGDEGAGRVVVCVHGWSCLVYSFRLLMPLLAAAGCRVVAMDLQGHGLSDKPPEPHWYTLDSLVQSVTGTMNALGVQRATLVGHSMGAPICARLAVQSPERVQALALLAPAGFGDEWAIGAARTISPRAVAPVLPYVVRRWMVAAILRFAYGQLYRPTPRDIDEYWAPSQFKGYARAMWDLLRCFDCTAGADRDFTRMTAPTAIFAGSIDHFVVHRWVRRYVAAMPRAAYIQIPGCGHVVPEEAPGVVRDAITSLIG